MEAKMVMGTGEPLVTLENYGEPLGTLSNLVTYT